MKFFSLSEEWNSGCGQLKTIQKYVIIYIQNYVSLPPPSPPAKMMSESKHCVLLFIWKPVALMFYKIKFSRLDETSEFHNGYWALTLIKLNGIVIQMCAIHSGKNLLSFWRSIGVLLSLWSKGWLNNQEIGKQQSRCLLILLTLWPKDWGCMSFHYVLNLFQTTRRHIPKNSTLKTQNLTKFFPDYVIVEYIDGHEEATVICFSMFFLLSW
jgi:hypothetical protein